MSKMVEKMELMQNRIDYLERSEKSFRQSISALIGANAQLRIKIQELEAKQDAMAATLATMEKKDSQQAESASNDADTQPQQIAEKENQRKHGTQRSTLSIQIYKKLCQNVFCLGTYRYCCPCIHIESDLKENNAYKCHYGKHIKAMDCTKGNINSLISIAHDLFIFVAEPWKVHVLSYL